MAWRWARFHKGFVAWGLLVVVVGVSLLRQQEQIDEAARQRAALKQTVALQGQLARKAQRLAVTVRLSQIRGCKRENVLRAALVENLKAQIRDTKATNPGLFPQIPPERFQQLIDEAVDRLRQNIGRVSQ